MSHYSVAVIVPKDVKEDFLDMYVDRVLEPFDENLEVEPYIAYTKDELKIKYEEYKEINPTEQISFEEFSNDYCGCGNDEDGNALSCYNKNSKWDWYEIGGRWDSIIKTKKSENVNYARIKDIVFTRDFNDLEMEMIKKEYKELIEKGDIYTPEYYKDRFPNLESYIKNQDFSTYAILDIDENWHEPGKMLYFGISEASPTEKREFENSYMDIINSQDEDSWLVVVDCHI